MKFHPVFRPGAWWLKFRQKFGHGLQVAYYRDHVRPRILQTNPVPGLNDDAAEVHVLTSKQDWLNLIWALKSFYAHSEHPFRLVIHEDGTLPAEGEAHLQAHFPEARLVTRKESDTAVFETLKDYPRCLQFRQTNHLSLKIMDFPLFLEADRMVLLDSDVLFYRRPEALMDRILDPNYDYNTVNGDAQPALTVTAEDVQARFGFAPIERYNSGLGLIHKASLRYDWMEEFLELPGILDHWWRIEQTLFALCSARFGNELLPSEYDVYLEKGLGSRPSRHYVGAIRHLMYGEGLKRLVMDGFLGERTEGRT